MAIAFCDRELCNGSVIRVEFRIRQKFVAAECGDQHAVSVRSPEVRERAALTKRGRALPPESFRWEATGHGRGQR